MTKRFGLLAGVLTAASLMQSAAAVPLNAEAVSVRSMQTRVFSYDFGGFQALYDTQTACWYTAEGAEIVPQTADVQRVENPFFGDADYGGSNIYAVTVDMKNMTIELECWDGTIISLDDLAAAFGDPMCSSILISQLLEMTPEYNPRYYDKAQQRDADVPKPADFPLTYVWRIAEGESEPAARKNADMYCDICFGEHLYSTFFALDGEITFQKAEDIAAEGTAVPFTDTGDANLDGTLDVSDAVLTSRIVAEDEGAAVSGLGMELADIDGDGLTTAGDVTEMLRTIAGLPALQSSAYTA